MLSAPSGLFSMTRMKRLHNLLSIAGRELASPHKDVNADGMLPIAKEKVEWTAALMQSLTCRQPLKYMFNIFGHPHGV
jgi:hypothetical protein